MTKKFKATSAAVGNNLSTIDAAFSILTESDDRKSATVFITEKLRVRVTRRLDTDFTVSVGKPNFRERAWVASRRKAGEPAFTMVVKFPKKRKRKTARSTPASVIFLGHAQVSKRAAAGGRKTA
jgi:hypothetical protein